MIEASAKLKYILFVDALIFVLCVAGLIGINQKAELPFDLTEQDSLFSILISPDNPYNLSSGDKLLMIEGLKINFSEKPEFITDRKNIGDQILVTVLSRTEKRDVLVRLTAFYSTFYLISTAIIALFFFIIAVFVLVKKPEIKAAYIFHWASVGIAVMMCLTWSNLNTFSGISAFVLRIPLHLAYVIVPPLFVHFTLIFPRDNTLKWRKLIKVNYFIAFVLAIVINYSFIYTVYVFTDSSIDNYLIVFGILRIYLIVGVILSISFFINAYIKEKGKVERKQLKWLLFGFIVGPLSFVILWVLPILFSGEALVPEEIVMLLFCAIPITFGIAIIKYHLLDIDEVLNRSIVYGIVISILLILYSAAIWIFVLLFHIFDQSIVSAVAAVLLAVSFQPMKTVVQQFVDKKFFRVQYNIRKELNRFNLEIKNFNDVEILGEYLITEIDNLIPVGKIAFSELDSGTGILTIRFQKGFDDIANKSLKIKSATLEQKWFQVAAVKNKVESEAGISTIFQSTLLRWKINLVVPIKSVKEDLYGFIILGNKKSGARFSTEDVDLLRDIGINTGTTIERIKLQEQLIREKLVAEKLEELNNQKSMFVSRVSHDLKTPLTSVKIFSEMLRENESSLSNNSREHLEIIEGETDRLTRLINNVLDYSKIEKGVKDYSFREINLNQIVKDVAKLMHYSLKMNGFTLDIQLEDFNNKVLGDSDAITEALENIISNAIRFSTDDKTIIIKSFAEDSYICISIEDHGIGIEKFDKEKIFDPFFRTTDAKAKKIEGTGLGLPIVKHILEQHNGKISVKSTPGIGSTFTLCFPALSNNKGGDNEENFNY
jgi:signal transduction histidine kinase